MTTTSPAVTHQQATLHRALAEPSRQRILEILQQAEAPLDARELAARVGLHLNTARAHLRLLAEAGLVKATRDRRPRPGRPRDLYQATAGPPDQSALAAYRLLAQILASALGSKPNPSARAEQAGHAWGAHLVQKPPPSTTITNQQALNELVRLHEQNGFKTELRQAKRGHQIVLKHCPLREVATTYQAVICSAHLGLIRGALAQLPTTVQADELQPFAQPDACIGHLTSG